MYLQHLEKYNKKHNLCVLISVIGFSLVVYLVSTNLLTQASIDGEMFILQSELETTQKDTTARSTIQFFNENIDFLKEDNNSKYTKNPFQVFQDVQVSTSNIFFVETRCATNKSAEVYRNSGESVLTARQRCAIESTARANPDRKIYVFLSCLSENVSLGFLTELKDLLGVTVQLLDLKAILKDSPVQHLGEIDALESSAYPVEHSSDILRLVLLWKFGGTYCDLDVVTVRSLEPLGTNWVGMQDSVTIANGVINISPSGTGHELMGRALERVAQNYNPAAWSANGPELITPLILDICGVDKVVQAVNGCKNFTVLNSSVLYPIYYPSWNVLFDATVGSGLVDELERTAYSIHVWNKMSHGMRVQLSSSQAYAILANKYCPLTAANVDEF